MSKFSAVLAALLCILPVHARQDKLSCGTYPDKPAEEYRLHLASGRVGEKRVRRASRALLAGERRIGGVTVRADAGNIAILDDSDGVVARRNPFNLNQKTLRFTPQQAAASSYRFAVAEGDYDSVTATAGTKLDLGDDDSRQISLPFRFPFFGAFYSSVFVNSDGNLTFNAGDSSSSDRSLGRMTSGEPRISGLFTDLDPTRGSGGVFTTASASSFVVSWVAVPEYQASGTGPLQTFQIRLFPDGRIEYAWSQVSSQEAVVGIAPGRLRGSTTVLSFLNTPTGEYTATVAERFTASERIDIFAAAQKFYLNHDDAYDYLVFYNDLGIDADDGAVAYEVTIRNQRTGYGDRITDIGVETGSPRRLQSLANMGPLSQYPKEPDGRVPARLTVGDTPITTLAHEAGHLFLAYASVRDANGGRPMLGGQAMAHWRFTFNSEASLMEGNRIQDNGPGAVPRFQTVATVEGYSPLDQYLMGLRAPEEVPDTFYVANPRGSGISGLPRVGTSFDGERMDVRITDVIAAEGRRTPDHTVAQQRFRFAIVLITTAGQEPNPEHIAQLELWRENFEAFFQRATSGRGFADTTLKRSLRVSTWPATGIVAGGVATGSVALSQPAPAPLTVLLRTRTGNAAAPASVVIPAGATQASFEITGVRAGTDELTLEPSDSRFEAVHTRLQVSAPAAMRLTVISGDKQPATPGVALPNPIRVRVTDINGLPYPGVAVSASPAGGGTLDSPAAITNEDGVVSFRWTPGPGVNELRAEIAGGAAVVATALGRPAIAESAVVNAASFRPGLSPGGIGTMFGTNFGGNTVSVLLNGSTVPVFYVDAHQINFHVPFGTAAGTAEIAVRTEVGTSDVVRAPVRAVQPGIFFDTASGYGAVTVAGSADVTQVRPVRRGQVIEIYGTGLGETQFAPDGNRVTAAAPSVTIGGAPAAVLFSGLTPGFVGLYQINARVPLDAPTGTQTLVIAAGGLESNHVQIEVR